MLEPPRPVLLDHDEAALGYACEMTNKLRRSGSMIRAWWLASWTNTVQ